MLPDKGCRKNGSELLSGSGSTVMATVRPERFTGKLSPEGAFSKKSSPGKSKPAVVVSLYLSDSSAATTDLNLPVETGTSSMIAQPSYFQPSGNSGNSKLLPCPLFGSNHQIPLFSLEDEFPSVGVAKIYFP